MLERNEFFDTFDELYGHQIGGEPMKGFVVERSPAAGLDPAFAAAAVALAQLGFAAVASWEEIERVRETRKRRQQALARPATDHLEEARNQ